MTIEKNKFEKIIDIINEPYENRDHKPNFYGRHILRDRALILVYTPRKEDISCGSSFRFNCLGDICSINGEIIVERGIEKDTSDKVKLQSCTVTEIRRYGDVMKMAPGKQNYRKESHIHFICKDKNYNNTINITKFLKEY